MKKIRIRELYELLFIQKTDRASIQFFRYLFVGGFSALADIGSLFLFASILDIHYLIAAAMAFIVGNIVNYFLSVAWVFRSSGQVKKELFFFTIIGTGGLILNEIIIWLLVEFVGLHYMVAKLISVSLVVMYSFNMRRVLLMKLNERLKQKSDSSLEDE